MEEFLRENSSLITRSIEVIAALTGLMLLKKYKQSATKYFIYFLVYVAVVVLIGAYPSYFANYSFLIDFKVAFKGTLFERNFWWYNIFWTIGSALFYSFYFFKILKTILFTKIIKFSCIVFFLSSIIYIATHWDALFSSQLTFLKIFGEIIIMLCVILYFIEMLKSDNILMFYKSINFYISATIFIWWLVITPLVFYQIYYLAADWNFVFLRGEIYLYANIFMYSSFAITLLWCKPETN